LGRRLEVERLRVVAFAAEDLRRVVAFAAEDLRRVVAFAAEDLRVVVGFAADAVFAGDADAADDLRRVVDALRRVVEGLRFVAFRAAIAFSRYVLHPLAVAVWGAWQGLSITRC
jgi:hypothetical protein